jgi:hypothetical protein
MFDRLRIDPAEFRRCVDVLNRKLDDIAAKAGVPETECADLEMTLAALPPFSRDRAALMLQGIQIQAEESFPAMAFAASYVLTLARDVWEGAPSALVRSSPDPLRTPGFGRS